MLSDLIASLTAAVSSAHRALGYLDEALDMRRRSRINRAAWQPHLDSTRAFVLAAAEKCPDRGCVVVLGSGLLLDLPLAELSAMFERVVLSDVVCLPETRRRIRAFRNVAYRELDVTGLAEQLAVMRRQGRQQLPEPAPPSMHEEEDLVVSLNILSQLWVVPRAFAGQRSPLLDPGQVDEWCGRIVESHYAWLRSLPCPVCLIADHEAVKRDRSGVVISRSSTVFGLGLPPTGRTWTWNIAPITQANPHASKELTVGAWFFPGPSA